MEEWEQARISIEADNNLARTVWGQICQPSESYQAPQDEDNASLMNLFARTPEALDRQVTAIHQIASQGENAGKVFSDYQHGKDIDIALLAACYQEPNTFITDRVLKRLMGGFSASMRRQGFPLTERYLKAFM